MKIVKIGDYHRIIYVAKAFTTGLTDVTGTAISPSGGTTAIPWSGSDPTAGFCELGLGLYYYDWNSTGKAAGKWSFKVDSTSKANPSADAVFVVDGDTLDNTPYEKLDTMLDTLISEVQSGTYGLAQIQSELAVVDGNVDDIEALAVGSDGFAAIKGVVDAVQTAVSGIGNSTKNTWLANTPVVVPDSGSITRRVWMNIFDSSGNMEDPDNQEIEVTVYNEAGTDVTSSYLAGAAPQLMTRSALGQYYIDFTIESTDNPIQLRFHHEYLESTNLVVRDGIVDVVGALAGDLETKLDNIETKIDTIDSIVDTINTNTDTLETGQATIEGKIDTVDTVVDGIATDLSSVDAKIDTIDTVVDGIQTDLDNATDGLGAIKTAVDANQADLTNIESKVDTIDTVVDGIQTDLDNATDGLGAIKAAVDANQADLTNIETKVDTIDSIVDTINTNTDGIESTLGTPAGASLAADIAAIQSDIDGLELVIEPGGYII